MPSPLSLALCALALALTLIVPAKAGAARGIEIGFAEPRFNSLDAGVRDFWHDRAKKAGGEWTRIGVGWRGIAATEPANPTQPGSYAFAGPDAAIRDAAARGQKILITVSRAPDWAEGPGRPANVEPGTWKPDPDALGQFAQALARRYDGTWPDPQNPGKALPRVSHFEAWNENNLGNFLSPQREGGKTVADDHYKLMLNAFYEGAHASQPNANVVAGSLSPIGTDQGGDGRERTGPLAFLREMFCLKGKRKPKAANCGAGFVVPKFDTFSHHPINADRKPLAKAKGDDAGVAEMGLVVDMLRTAEKAGHTAGAGKHPVWNTEFWWNSNPPKKGRKFPNLKKHAQYIQETLYLNWKDGVEMAMLYQVGDDSSLTFQTGVYFENGKPKPAQKAFRFPLVGDRKSKKKVLVWGRAPANGKVKIQAKKKGKKGKKGFKTVKKKKVKAGDVFKTKTKLKGKGKLRAKLGKDKSLVYKVGKK